MTCVSLFFFGTFLHSEHREFGMAVDRPEGYNESLYRAESNISIEYFMHYLRDDLKKANKELAKKLDSGPKPFADIQCKRELLAKPTPLKINLIYEIHGSPSSRRTKKVLIDKACENQSYLLLESELTEPRIGLDRTIAMANSSCKTTNVQGLDGDAELRTLWALSSFADDSRLHMDNSRDKPVFFVHQALMEELLRNPQFRASFEGFRTTLVNRSGLGGHDSTIQRLLTSVDQFAAAQRGSHIKMSESFVNKEISSKDLWSLVHAVKEYSFQSYVRKNPVVYNFLEQKIKAGRKKMRHHLDNASSPKIKTVSDVTWDQDVVMDAGFNRRDTVFVNEIGKGICAALGKGLNSIDVLIGAGHLDGVLERLKISLAEKNLTTSISVETFSTDDFVRPVRSTDPDNLRILLDANSGKK